MSVLSECPTVAQLQNLLDQSLDGEQSITIEEHIVDCKRCQDTLDTLTGDAFQSAGKSSGGSSSRYLQRAMSELKTQSSPNLESRRQSRRGLSGGFPDTAKSDRSLGALGRYDVLREIASGAIGVLFEAWDNELNRRVAIKVLKEIADSGQSRERLLREAQATVRLRHRNIVEVYDIIDRDDFQTALVMELIEEGSVADLLSSGPVSPTQAAYIVQQAAIGVEQAHQAKLVHRDIKPSNLLMETEQGELKRICVADFGLVSALDSDSQLTRTGEIAGTPAYMSPEQVESPSEVAFASDIYSLGCVLYELLTGRVPFDGTVRMVLWQVLHEEPLPPSRFDDRIPKPLEAICLKAMSKSPEKRYDSANELASDLQRFLDGHEVEAKLPSLMSRFSSQVRKYPTLAASVGVTALMVVAVAVISTVYAFQLASARRETELQAQKADRGKEIALEVLESIVFDAYDELDQLYFDSDELQIQLLSAAAEGLSRIENQERTPDTLFKRAETHARLARAMWRVEEYEDARQQLDLANETLAMIPTERRQSEAAERLQLQVLEYEIAIADEQGEYRRLNSLQQQSLLAAKRLSQRDDVTLLGLRTAAEIFRYYAEFHQDDATECEDALIVALSVHRKVGGIVDLPTEDEVFYRFQLLRELAEVYYFDAQFAKAESAWTHYRNAVTSFRQLDEQFGLEVNPSALEELFHADAGLAASELELSKVDEAVKRLDASLGLFQREARRGLFLIDVSEGIWQLVDTALSDRLIKDAKWELKWLRFADSCIDQEAEFLGDLSLIETQISWKEKFLASLQRNEAKKDEVEKIRDELRRLNQLLVIVE
ncbi:MAG: protein kinase [Planctomycetota bacterium]